MDDPLSFSEARVLGCLLEKEATTPEHYPLTLNGLVAACNQKSNRDPVVDYGEEIVVHALEGLRGKHLALRLDIAGSRVPKYRHTIGKLAECTKAQRAVLCVLLLRGPQTIGELRSRTDRIHPFRDLAEVEKVLKELIELEPEPLVTALPRQPGKKEVRHAHLLCGPPAAEEPDNDPTAPGDEAMAPRPSLRCELEELRETVGSLESRLAELESRFDAFRGQFE